MTFAKAQSEDGAEAKDYAGAKTIGSLQAQQAFAAARAFYFLRKSQQS
jgi:hypothetical protein